MSPFEWISVAGMAISGVFAGWSWWEANKSRRARQAADEATVAAREQADAAKSQALSAQEQARATRDQADAVRALIRSMQRPPLDLHWLGNAVFTLTSATGRDVVIDEVVNRDKFMGDMKEIPDGSVIPLGESVRVKCFASAQFRPPSVLVLRVDGISEPISLDLSGRPRSGGRVR
jgi:hypothetical protein